MRQDSDHVAMTQVAGLLHSTAVHEQQASVS